MKTTVDAFGAEVVVGDTVVFMASNRKSFETGEVVKCTKHGATVSCNRVHENTCVNVRNERVYKVDNSNNRFNLLSYTDERVLADKLEKSHGEHVLYGGHTLDDCKKRLNSQKYTEEEIVDIYNNTPVSRGGNTSDTRE